jgi:hypothetical protein
VITYLDVAWIARRFGAAYRPTVSRLLGQGLLSEADSTRLLKPKLVELAGEWMTLFRFRGSMPQPAYDIAMVSDVPAEHAHTAVEAFRRGLITKAQLLHEAMTLSLQVPGLTDAKLWAFAEATR